MADKILQLLQLFAIVKKMMIARRNEYGEQIGKA